MNPRQNVPLMRHQRKLKSQLAKFSLFDCLTELEFEILIPLLEIRTFNAGVVVIERGKSGSGLLLLVEGSVKIFLGESGASHGLDSEVLITTCGPGEALGEIDIVDGRGHTASVATREKSSFLWLSPENFWHCHDSIPRLGRNLSRILAGRLRLATISHDVYASMPLLGRVAFQLLRLANDCGVHQPNGSVMLPVKISQNEMASLVGSSRECVNRIIVDFKKQGYIEAKRGCHILIMNSEVLHEFCHGLAPLPKPKLELR